MTTLDPLHQIDLKNGRFDGTSPADLQALFAAAAAHANGRNLVIHFHGGLVARPGALQTAATMRAAAEAGQAYPIFFIWNSDLLTTLAGNLTQIGQEEAFKRLVRRIAQIVLSKLGEKAGGRGAPLELVSIKQLPSDMERLEETLTGREAALTPPDDLSLSDVQETQAEQLLRDDLALRTEAARIANGLRRPEEIESDLKTRGAAPVQGSTQTLMSAAILQEIAAESPDPGDRSAGVALTLVKFGVQIAIAVLKRYTAGRDHGLYSTIVEETLRALYLDNVGILTWSLMKNDTADAFGPDPQTHGGTAFVRELAARWQPGQRVTLVGHSTGAIYITEFIKAIDPLLPADARLDVIFLAGAASFPYLHQNLDPLRRRIGRIRTFGLTDAQEMGYWEVPLLYKGSLLYLVSGLLEEGAADQPLIGMARYFSGRPPYDLPEVTEVLDALLPPETRVWSGEGSQDAGRRCTATKHGMIDDEDAPTLESLTHILANGF